MASKALKTKKTTTAVSTPILITALADGDTFSRSKRVPVGSVEATDLNAVLTKLRNNVNQGVSRVRRDTGSNFRVESGVMLTDDKTAHICTVAVTRLNGGEADPEQEDGDDDDDEVDI